MSAPPVFSKMAILGVGYIGGSAALAARKAGLAGRFVGYDADSSSTALAQDQGTIDEVAATPESAVAGADLVLLAAPVASLSALARRIAGALSPTALVIDVGSVKAPLVEEMATVISGGRFVGCHPLAGTERSGVAAADGAIFADRLCLVCPGTAHQDAVARASEFWRAIGCHVMAMEARAHDAVMAATSHLPHVAAFSMAASLAESFPLLEGSGRAAESTTSLRDTTRIAASNPAVWRDIFLGNRENLLPLVRGLERRVAAIGAAIESGDAHALERLLSEARACRERLMRVGGR